MATFLITLACCALVLISGCTGSQTASPEAVVAPQEYVKISVWSPAALAWMAPVAATTTTGAASAVGPKYDSRVGRFEPEMLVRFTHRVPACATRKASGQAGVHGHEGEITKLAAMLANKDMGCVQLSPAATYKVIAVDYPPDNLFGILELVPADSVSANGVLAFADTAKQVAR